MFYLNRKKIKQALIFIVLLTTPNLRGPMLLVWSLERKRMCSGRRAIANLKIQLVLKPRLWVSGLTLHIYRVCCSHSPELILFLNKTNIASQKQDNRFASCEHIAYRLNSGPES